MLLSSVFVALTMVATPITVNASPFSTLSQPATQLRKRQDVRVPCSFVLRTSNDDNILDVNLLQKIRGALTQALNETAPGGVVVETTREYDISRLDNSLWAWAWIPLIFNGTDFNILTPEQSTEASVGLIGHSTTTGLTTWTVEDATCDASVALTSAASDSEGSFTVTRSGGTLESRLDSTSALARRQDDVRFTAECSFTLRPENQEGVFGASLVRDTFSIYFRGILANFPDITGLVANNPDLFSLNTDGTWSFVHQAFVFGPEGVLWTREEIIERSESLVGFQTTLSTGWTIAAASCRPFPAE